ncbi:hypothetical protein CEXT_642631 [Caerostris extrusa]|uniref:Uncharacterized protein n=1 Tax=Caerostris extrusa TaxID=172846 RepID=A0AAV4RGN4_CAEEX|nr:hypothetical protein CEXT_642631 [Caerostris extrusa]
MVDFLDVKDLTGTYRNFHLSCTCIPPPQNCRELSYFTVLYPNPTSQKRKVRNATYHNPYLPPHLSPCSKATTTRKTMAFLEPYRTMNNSTIA